MSVAYSYSLNKINDLMNGDWGVLLRIDGVTWLSYYVPKYVTVLMLDAGAKRIVVGPWHLPMRGWAENTTRTTGEGDGR